MRADHIISLVVAIVVADAVMPFADGNHFAAGAIGGAAGLVSVFVATGIVESNRLRRAGKNPWD